MASQSLAAADFCALWLTRGSYSCGSITSIQSGTAFLFAVVFLPSFVDFEV